MVEIQKEIQILEIAYNKIIKKPKYFIRIEQFRKLVLDLKLVCENKFVN